MKAKTLTAVLFTWIVAPVLAMACPNVTGEFDCKDRPFESFLIMMDKNISAQKITIKQVTDGDPESAEYSVQWDLYGQHFVKGNDGIPFSGHYETGPYMKKYSFRWVPDNDGTGQCHPSFDSGSSYTINSENNLDYTYGDWGTHTICERIK